MIFRAQASLPSNTQLTFPYISALDPLTTRQQKLSKYGFTCACEICVCELATPPENLKKRQSILDEIIANFSKTSTTPIETYYTLLTALSTTYAPNPPTREPHRTLIMPITNLLTVCRATVPPRHTDTIKLSTLLLQCLGFEISYHLTTNARGKRSGKFEMTRWGFMADEVVPALADLWDAYK